MDPVSLTLLCVLLLAVLVGFIIYAVKRKGPEKEANLSPRYEVQDGKLVLRGHPFLRHMTLGGTDRRAVVDPGTGTITIERYTFWRLRSREEIPFERVLHVNYDHTQIRETTGHEGGTELIDQYTISLALGDPQETALLAEFRGSIFYPDAGLASRGFAEALCETIGTSIGVPLPVGRDREGRTYWCTDCQRPSPPRLKKCQYCGGSVQLMGELDTEE